MDNVRNRVPDNLTPEEWEQVKEQADEWGFRFEIGFPGTKYNKDALTLDYSGNEDAITAFSSIGNKDHTFFTPLLACLYKEGNL